MLAFKTDILSSFIALKHLATHFVDADTSIRKLYTTEHQAWGKYNRVAVKAFIIGPSMPLSHDKNSRDKSHAKEVLINFGSCCCLFAQTED